MSWAYHPWPDYPNTTFGGPGVRLADPRSPNSVRNARRAKSRLRGPVVVTPAVTATLARPTKVVLAPQRRRRAKSSLPQLLPVNPPVVYGGPRVRLVSPRDRVPATVTRLGPPILAPAVVATFSGPKETLARQSRRQRQTLSRLSPPKQIVPSVSAFIQGYLAPPRDRVPPTISRLSPPIPPPIVAPFDPIRTSLAPSSRGTVVYQVGPPVVVSPAPLAQPTEIKLARSRRGKTKSFLHRTVVAPAATAVFSGPTVTLVRTRPSRTHPFLRAPVVVGGFVVEDVVRVTLVRIRPVRTVARLLSVSSTFRPVGVVNVTLAYSRRGKAKPILRKPTVIDLTPQTRFLAVALAYSRRGKPRSFLGRPTDLVDQADLGFLRVQLAPSSRGKAKSFLRKPVVVAQFSVRPTDVTLARIRPVRTTSLLRRPADLVDQQDLGFLRVHLAYSLRGKPKSTLRPPRVVAPVLARPTAIHLAPSFRGTPKPLLSPPTVVFPFIARPTDITLVRIRPVPTATFLRPPTDISDRDDLGATRVYLAPSTRGVPKSRLEPPTVVGPVLARAIVTKLARIRPVKTRWALKPPTVVRLAVELSGPEVTLVRIRPPRTTWLLREPVAGAAQLKAERDLRVTLAYQSRGEPKSKLRPPVVVTAATPYFRREPVTLVRIRPRRPLAILRDPAVVTARRELAPILVSLSPQRRGKAKSFLRAPVAVSGFVVEGVIDVTLAYSRRGSPTSFLRPSGPVPPLAPPLAVTLAPSKRGTPSSLLRPPAVVGAGIAFFGPTVTTVRIRPARTQWFLNPPTVQVQECYGDVVGFDFAPEVCGSDEGATVIGTTSADQVSGSDSGATVQGASASRGSVTGGDEKREGC